MQKVLHIVSYPVHVLVKGRAHWIRLVVGSTVACCGVCIAKFSPHALGEFFPDAVGYMVHTVGCSHVIRVINDILKFKIDA